MTTKMKMKVKTRVNINTIMNTYEYECANRILKIPEVKMKITIELAMKTITKVELKIRTQM